MLQSVLFSTNPVNHALTVLTGEEDLKT